MNAYMRILLMVLVITHAVHAQSVPPLSLETVASGLDKPVGLAAAPGDTNRLFVIERETGKIKIVMLDTKTVLSTPFLTVTPLFARGGEEGLLGLTFHPQYASNGYFYVHRTMPSDEIVRYRVQGDPGTSNVADPASATIIFVANRSSQSNHHAGWLGFGPDGYLYVAMGDGGGANNPSNSAQNRASLFGKMLRIDVDRQEDGRHYAIPVGNPYKGHASFRGEIWAFGLRNPWRCSFDRANGDLWIGDVGQSDREEIDRIPAGVADLNFGWRCREGKIANPNITPEETPVTPATDPVHEFNSSDPVIGGYVYRGADIPGLPGKYVFTRYIGKSIGSFRFENGSATNWAVLGSLPAQPYTLGEDARGELYFGLNNGSVVKLRVATPVLSFASASSSGSEATTAVNLTVNLAPAASTSVTVNYSVIAGTATGGGVDYTLNSGTLSFAAGQTSQTIALSVANDVLAEPNETVVVGLSNPSNASLGAQVTHTYTINDNDTLPQVSFALASSTVSESAGSASLTVNLSAPFSGTVTAPYSVTTGTATGGGVDYTLASGSLTFSAGQTTRTLALAIHEDLLDEPNETVQVSLGTPINATLGFERVHTLTIADNDGPPSITSVPPLAGNVGALYTYDVNATGTGTIAYELIVWPAGMTIDGATGLIRWTPTAAGAFQVVVVASNGTAPDAAQNLTIQVTDYGLATRPAASPYLNMPQTESGAIPPRLSQTGAFSNVAALTPAPALIPFDVNSPLWSDGSHKLRWVSVPSGARIGFAPTGSWTYPAGTVFVKHFELATDETAPNVYKRLETRLLVVKSDGSVYGVTYKWRADHTDADLLTAGLDETLTIRLAGGGIRNQTWTYPSSAQCLQCHNPVSGYVLGPHTRQLNRSIVFPGTGVTDNQLRAWNHAGLFSTVLQEASIPGYAKLAALNDAGASVEHRARSYLDSNCSHCHRPGGAPANFDARFDTALAVQNLVNGSVGDMLGEPFAKVIAPSSVPRSIAHKRMALVGANQMPPLARHTVDTQAVQVLAQWIGTLPQTHPVVAITTPAESSSHTGTLSVAANAHDPDADTGDGDGIAQVVFELRQGAAAVLTWADAQPPYAGTLDLEGIPSGDYTLRARADSLAFVGGTSTYDEIPVRIAAVGPAREIVLQEGLNGYTGTQDTYLYMNGVTSNYGNQTALLAGTTSTGTAFRNTLIRFAIFRSEGGPVPDGAIVETASLEFYQSASSTVSCDFAAHRVLKPWNEMEATAARPQIGATWTATGALGIGTDVQAAADGSASVSRALGWYAVDVTAGVNQFAQGVPNYGWRLALSTSGYIAKTLISSEHTSAVQRPQLRIAYRANLAPEILSEPWALPNPAAPSQPVSLDVVAGDEEGDALTYSWTQVSGPSAAVLEGESGESARIARFPLAGTYVLRVTVSDGTLSDSASVTVNVADASAPRTVVLQEGLDGYLGTQDTYLYMNGASTNYGNKATLQHTTQTSGSPFRIVLLRFAIFQSDGGPVPDGATIDSALLSLYQNAGSTNSASVGAHRLLKPWKELEATALRPLAGSTWTLKGALGLGSDISATPDGTILVAPAAGWYSLNVTAGVQAFAAGAPNCGWELLRQTQGYTNKSFQSSEASTAAQRPKLTVIYRAP